MSGALVHAPAAQQRGRGRAALEQGVDHHLAPEPLGRRAVVRAQDEVEQGRRLRGQVAAAAHGRFTRGDDEVGAEVFARADGVHLQARVPHSHRPAERDGDRVLHVKATRACGRDDLSVRVEQHRPAVDAPREFGDDGGDAAAPRDLGEHLGSRGDESVLRGLVGREQGDEQRMQHGVGCLGPHDRRGARRFDRTPECSRRAAADEHGAAERIGARAAGGERRCEVFGAADDERREAGVADDD